MAAATSMGRAAAPGEAPAVRDARREARLRPEHAQQYPGIRPGQWEPAATLADRVLAGTLLRGKATSFRVRLLCEEHFEFRGGVARVMGGGEGRPRREDR